MSIVLTLTPEIEALLRSRADRQGQDINLVASELLANLLTSEEQDFQEAIQGIKQGLDDFEAGRFRSFDEFSAEKRRQYGLSSES
jgi:predicted transcriptional regulator